MPPPLRAHDVVFYDALCGLCQRRVLFVLKHDRAARFRFAPLDSDLFRSLTADVSCGTANSLSLLRERVAHPPGADVSGEGSDRVLPVHLANTVVVRRTDGSLLVRSSATLYILRQLGGFWRVLGIIGWLVPRPLRDAVYRAVARRRHRFGPPPPEACPVVPPEWRERFIK